LIRVPAKVNYPSLNSSPEDSFFEKGAFTLTEIKVKDL